MDKSNVKRIVDLMRADLITINGGKNNLRVFIIIITVFFAVMGFLTSPIVCIYVPMIMGIFFVQMLFKNEMKYHSEKMYAVLPVSRKDHVRARFVLSAGLYVAMNLLLYMLMILSMKLRLYRITFGADVDFLELIAQHIGGLTGIGFFNLLYSISFAIGAIPLAGTLRKYFKDNRFASLSLGNIEKSNKKEVIILAVIIVAIILLYVLVSSGVIPVGDVFLLTLQLLIQLAKSANGVLCCLVFLTIALFSVIHSYVCTILEYDEKEL